jgi:hypothetical protein
MDAGTTNTNNLGLTTTSSGAFTQYRAYQLLQLGAAGSYIETTGTEL